jgi:hypothetical protein
MAIVADQYDFVIGVDTHAASHTLALIAASTGAVRQQASSRPVRLGCAVPSAGSNATPKTRRR